jgi:hypothetical protein
MAKGWIKVILSVTSGHSLDNIAQPQIIDDTVEKVHILDSFVESDAESEALSERLRKIDAYNDEEQGGSQVNENNSEQQAWFIQEDANVVIAPQILNVEIQMQKKNAFINTDIPSEVAPTAKNSLNEREMVDDAFINCQESVVTDDGQVGAVVGVSEGQNLLADMQSDPSLLADMQNLTICWWTLWFFTNFLVDTGPNKIIISRLLRREKHGKCPFCPWLFLLPSFLH